MSDDRKGYCDRHMTAYRVIDGCLYCTPGDTIKTGFSPAKGSTTETSRMSRLNQVVFNEVYNLNLSCPHIYWTGVGMYMSSTILSMKISLVVKGLQVVQYKAIMDNYECEIRNWIKSLVDELQ